jgi:hypothetical protein
VEGDREYVPILASYDSETLYVEWPDDESAYLAIDLLQPLRAIFRGGADFGRGPDSDVGWTTIELPGAATRDSARTEVELMRRIVSLVVLVAAVAAFAVLPGTASAGGTCQETGHGGVCADGGIGSNGGFGESGTVVENPGTSFSTCQGGGAGGGGGRQTCQ